MLILLRQSSRLFVLILVAIVATAFGPLNHDTGFMDHKMPMNETSMDLADMHSKHDDHQSEDMAECCEEVGLCASVVLQIADAGEFLIVDVRSNLAPAILEANPQSSPSLDIPPPKFS